MTDDGKWYPPGGKHHPFLFWMALVPAFLMALPVAWVVTSGNPWFMLLLLPLGVMVLISAQVAYWLDPAPWRCSCPRHSR